MNVVYCCVFFFNDTATTEIYTLSLHDALPIYPAASAMRVNVVSPSPSGRWRSRTMTSKPPGSPASRRSRSEEHTSELQSRQYLVCRLLLEKKKIIQSFILCQYHTDTTYEIDNH